MVHSFRCKFTPFSLTVYGKRLNTGLEEIHMLATIIIAPLSHFIREMKNINVEMSIFDHSYLISPV